MTTPISDNRFTHLHIHTEYSMLDGISRIPQLVAQAKEMGMDSLAITDHGSMYGVVDFYLACKEAGIKPIIGCEVYVAKGSRFDKSPNERSPYHLVLLARNNEGYRNLMQLVTRAHVDGFHYRPRIDRELLEQNSAGLIALSGCASGEVPRLIVEGNLDEAAKVARWYKDVFGNGYFFELQHHEHVEQLPEINQGLVTLSSQLDIPLVVTNDAHYVKQAEAPLQDVYICIQTNTTVQDEKRLRMEDESYYVKSPLEMAELFPDFPEALSNTNLIADMCDVELNFDQTHLPKYPVPGDASADEYLAQLCWDGFKQRYPSAQDEAVKRLEYELEVIKHTSFANYFLVVWDIIKFVRKSEILYGVRGSAAASVALYCLNITNVDPLEYRLVFERFLNLERKEMPDIDLDFQDDRRDEVLHYVIDKYGREKVAQIITFGTLGAKAALRDVGRGLGMTYNEVDRIARMVPFKARTLEDALRVNPEFQEVYDSDQVVHKLVDTAQGLEGIVHHVSTHAAGVLIAEDPLAETVPLQRPSRGDESSPVLMTQYSMDPVAKLGLLKMDFLGLTNLTILDRAVKLVEKNQGIKIDLDRLRLDDKPTFELLSSGNTTDLFQLESAGMRRYIKELKPSNLGDIAAMIALYRPGPMENIDSFIAAKYGRIPITYPHPSFKDLLDETYGIIVYQDQVLLILQQFAGYTLGEADIVRKAMGKKIASLMAAERERFVSGALANGYDSDVARTIFDLIEPFAGYAFNKAHSISYALISYWTAYFKTHYPLEYMGSVLNSRMDHPEKMVTSINECFQLGIPVLLPDINKSDELFAIDEGDGTAPGLRVGLAAVKTVGESAVRPLLEERDANGPYKSIDDFCRRANGGGLNRRTMESLAKAGAFDSLAPRGAVLGALDQIVALAQLEARNRDSGQSSLFSDASGEAGGGVLPGVDLSNFDVSSEQKVAWEQELLGVALSENPRRQLAALNTGDAFNSMDQLEDEMQGQTLSVLGYVSSVTERYTKEQKKFLVVAMELLGGSLEVVVWPNVLEQTQDKWVQGAILLVTGRLQLRNDQLTLACDKVQQYQEDRMPPPSANGNGKHRANGNNGAASAASNGVSSNGAAANGHKNGSAGGQQASSRQPAEEKTSNGAGSRTVSLAVKESDNAREDAHLLREVIGVLLEYSGHDRVNLDIKTVAGRVLMELPTVSTSYCEELDRRVSELLGAESVRLYVEAPQN